MYGIRRGMQHADTEESKRLLESTVPKLPPINPPRASGNKFNNEYTFKKPEENPDKGDLGEIVEEVASKSRGGGIDEIEADGLIQWAQELPEEISSSLNKKV